MQEEWPVIPDKIMNLNSKIYVAGHRGLVGSTLLKKLRADGYTNIIVRMSKELDLRRQADVESFFARERPEYVFLAAAKVGGILANNTYKAEFIYDNIMIAANVISAAHRCGVKKLLNLGSSCIYPKLAPQPLKEEYLLTGALEPTNEPYAIAKIAAIKLCRYYNERYGTDFISVMPTNLYGPNDNFDLETSHVLPALIRKFHEAKVTKRDSVVLWGTGEPMREFLYVDDLADACVFLMNKYDNKDIGEFINIGTGSDIKIAELAQMIKRITGFEGQIHHDHTKPDGTPRKLLDITKIRSLGWQPKTILEDGLRMTYAFYTSMKT
jgi:GDP-L-fucose synthase